MAKKSSKSKKAKQNQPHSHDNNQVAASIIATKAQHKEARRIIALERANSNTQGESVETSSPLPENVETNQLEKSVLGEEEGLGARAQEPTFPEFPEPASKSEEQTSDAAHNEPTEPEPKSTAFFQAIGIIHGQVNFSKEGPATVTIGRQEYPLLYVPRNRLAFTGLKKEIERSGARSQRLIVYPKVTHFPKRDMPHKVFFQLVGFDAGQEPEGISAKLQDLEFKLCGLWQFIPVSKTPCISVFKNFTKDRLDYIKEAEAATRVRFMKASHLPLLWRDSPVRPFRFNPKASFEEQGHPAFVEVKARFMPGRDCFGFVETLAEPQEKAPKFLKVSKKDKETALKAKNSGGQSFKHARAHRSRDEQIPRAPRPINYKGHS